MQNCHSNYQPNRRLERIMSFLLRLIKWFILTMVFSTRGNVTNLYPFGSNTGDGTLKVKDDHTSQRISTPEFPFFGRNFTGLHVSTCWRVLAKHVSNRVIQKLQPWIELKKWNLGQFNVFIQPSYDKLKWLFAHFCFLLFSNFCFRKKNNVCACKSLKAQRILSNCELH